MKFNKEIDSKVKLSEEEIFSLESINEKL